MENLKPHYLTTSHPSLKKRTYWSRLRLGEGG